MNLEWQVESTIDYMCNTCDEGKGLKVGEDGKTFKWERKSFTAEMGELCKLNTHF